MIETSMNQRVEGTQGEMILGDLNDLAQRAEGLVSILEQRLHPVTRDIDPLEPSAVQPSTVFVPLFRDYKERIARISSVLDRVDSCISRLEI